MSLPTSLLVRWCFLACAWQAVFSVCCWARDFREINPPVELGKERLVALLNARLIDGNEGPAIERASVIVRGPRIAALGDYGTVDVPETAERIDLSGMTIVPGLVDCHFHSTNDLRPPRTFLRNGITTFRDPGHPFRFYQAVVQAKEPMPRVFLCGAHLDAYPPIWPEQAALVDDDARARHVVEEHFQRGATAIKVYFRLPVDLIEVVCDAAHRKGLPVTAHLELVAAIDAIEAGVDGIEHVTSFGTSLCDQQDADEFVATIDADPDLRRQWRYRLWEKIDLDDESRVNAVIDTIVENEIVVSPTLAVFERRADDDGVSLSEVRGFQNMLKFVGQCHQRGAILVVGSHTWVPGAKFGWAFQREMELLVECGMSPAEVLTAATRSGARFLRTDDRLGILEPGKLADLLVVEGNPHDDISQMRSIRRVMLSGRWVRP